MLNKIVQSSISSKNARVTCFGDKPAADRGIFKLAKKFFATAALAALVSLAGSSAIISHESIGITAVQEAAPDIYGNEKDSSKLSDKMFDNGKLFLAIATLIENVKTEVYYDAAGANIGIGYCIDRQMKDHGVDAVMNDLHQAGIPARQARLLTGSPDERSMAHIAVTQAINLLDITSDRYVKAAKKWLGNEHYDHLTDMQKTAITYLVYNVGAHHISGFKKLKSAIIAGHAGKIKHNITPMFRAQNGKWQKNDRVGSLLTATWFSKPNARPKQI
jgi:hypothetical protein